MSRRSLKVRALAVIAMGLAAFATTPRTAAAAKPFNVCYICATLDFCTYGGDATCAAACVYYNGAHACYVDDTICDTPYYTLACGADETRPNP